MEALIYVHPKGQFWLATSKIGIKPKQRNFIQIYYDVTNYLSSTDDTEMTCKEYHKFDNCVTDVGDS